MTHVVTDVGVVIHMLFTACDSHAQERRFGVFAVDADVIAIAGDAVGKCDAVDKQIGAGGLSCPQCGSTARGGGCCFEVVVVEGGTFAEAYLNHLVAEALHIATLGVVAHEHSRLSTVFEHHKYAAYSHHGLSHVHDVHKLESALKHHIARHIHEDTVLRKQRVESYLWVA